LSNKKLKKSNQRLSLKFSLVNYLKEPGLC